MDLSIQERVFELLAEIDAVAAEEEHRTTTLSSGEPSLGLGLVALTLSEQWRPKRTERLRLYRDDAVETEFLCELDLDAARAVSRTTRRSHGIWLPLHRLRCGLMPPASATDDTGAQLPVMSRGEVAAHVGAGVAQILGSGVFRDAFTRRSRHADESPEPQELRRRTPASVILREAVTRILMRSWSNERQSPQPIDPTPPGGCETCEKFSDRPPLTLREFGLARYLLHQAAHTWLSDAHACQDLAFKDLGGLSYLNNEDPTHAAPHFVVDSGLNALEVVRRGAIVVAQAHKLTGRTTITTALPPRQHESAAQNRDADARDPAPRGGRTSGSPRRYRRLLLEPLVVPYEVELSGLRLNQALGLEARVEDGVELIPVPSKPGTNRPGGSYVSVLLMESAALRSPPTPTSDATLPRLGADSPESNRRIPPHPVPELSMALDNLARARNAHPTGEGFAPLPLGTFAALNRCGAHAAQVARLLEVTDRTDRREGEQLLIGELRAFSRDCQDMIEDRPKADFERLTRLWIEGGRLVKKCEHVPTREQRFVDANHQPGEFRCEIGRKDIPDRFIRPVLATAKLRARLEPGLAASLRRQVLIQFTLTSVLLAAMTAIVWLVRPSSEPVITILLVVPAGSVYLQLIPNVATLRSQLAAPYRMWQYISLVAPVLGAFTALPLKQCDEVTSWRGACGSQPWPWWQVGAPVLSCLLFGLAFWRLTFTHHSASAFSVSSFEPINPSYDELRQIGQTAADSATRATQRGPWYVVARSSDRAFRSADPTEPLSQNVMGLPEVAPTSEFWVRLGSRHYEFTSVRALEGTATTELLRPVLMCALPHGEPPIIRSFSSVADAPVFGSGQLSEAWLAWNAPEQSDPGPFVRDVALLGAAYQGPLSYFHLRSWENGHLFSRVGTLLSQRGHRDEIAFEGAVSSIARRRHPGPTPHGGHDYLSFLPPTFLQMDAPPEPVSGPLDEGDEVSYWDVIVLATAATDTAHNVMALFTGHPNVTVLDGSMTILRGIEATVLALRLESPGCDDGCQDECDCLKRRLDVALRGRLDLEDDLIDAPRLSWQRVDDDYRNGDQLQRERHRRTLWVGWTGSADHADCNWLLGQVRSWFQTMASHAHPELRIDDLQLDYLVCRQRRGTTQVGRARISFVSVAHDDRGSFGVWERTLTKSLQYSPPEGTGRGTPAGLIVDVQRFEPRSQRYSGSKLGGEAP